VNDGHVIGFGLIVFWGAIIYFGLWLVIGIARTMWKMQDLSYTPGDKSKKDKK